MGKTISSLPMVTEASGADVVPVWSSSTGADSRITLARLPISDAVQAALDELSSGGGGTTSVDEIAGLVDGAADNQSAFMLSINNAATDSAVRRRISTQGEYRSSRLDMPPAISLVCDARGGVFLEAADSMPELTSDGAENSLLRVMALTPAFGGVRSWTSEYSGFNLNGRKGSQTYPIMGIRMPNPNPTENTNDPDPNYTTNKDYAATRLRNVEITECKGPGVKVEAGRGRFFAQDVRAINGSDNGMVIASNDFIIGHRCATGGNEKTGMVAGGGSGGLFDGVNMWGKYIGFRSKNCIAFKSNDTKGGVMNMSVLNDGAWFNGDTSSWRGWCFYGNLISPHNEAFYADGYGYDIDNPTPGTEDPITQSAVTVTGYTNYVVGPNLWSRTTKCPDFNTNGNPDGDDGTAYQYLINVDEGAHVNCELPVSVITRDKPWFSADPVGIRTQGAGAIANYRQHAIGSNYGLHRFGTKGSGTTSHFMACADESAAYNSAYAVWLSDQGRRNQILGYTEFGCGPILQSTAVDGRPATNGASRTINDKQAVQTLSISGTIAAFTVKLPYIPNGSKQITISFTGGNITALTWQTTRADGTTLDTVPSADDRFQDQTASYLPSTIQGLTTVRLYWREETLLWQVDSISQRGEPWIILTDEATISTNADLGCNFKVTLGGNRTLSNPNNLVDGQPLSWEIIQDGTGSRTLAYGAKFTFLGVTETPRVTPTAGAIDLLIGVYDAAADKIFCSLIKASAAHWTALAYAATLNTNCDLGTSFNVGTLTGDITSLNNPTNLRDGMKLQWRFTQDGTGSRLLSACGGKFRWPGGLAANALSTTAGAIDIAEGEYDATADIIWMKPIRKAYAA